MSKLRALVMAGTATLSAAGVLWPSTVVHAAATPIPANACSGGDAQCRDYIVPTSWLDTPGNPVDIFLEAEHATDTSGNIIPAPLILTYSPYSILRRTRDSGHWNGPGY